jgi:hypothetical protein
MEGVAATLLFLIALVVIYFAPTIVACLRKHNNDSAILVLNFFLGWTLIGWVLALVWAFTSNVKADSLKQ